MKVFLSYTRCDETVAKAVAEDIEELEHSVWYDREVAGGQAWWDAILEQILNADLFVFVLTTKSQDSQACKAEYTYASQLQKRILPILCGEGVRVNLLPPELSRIQYVPYLARDRQAAFALLKAFKHLPPPTQAPDSLPSPPAIPISYLSGLRVQLDADRDLNIAEQSKLAFELKRGLEDQDSREDALTLLRLLRRRRDLYASVAEEIDSVLKLHLQEKISHPVEKTSAPQSEAAGVPKDRKRGKEERLTRRGGASNQPPRVLEKYAKEAVGSPAEPISPKAESIAIGNIYEGRVIEIEASGCVVEFAGGQRGFCTIGQLADPRVSCCEDVVAIGDVIAVRFIGLDSKGRMKLSRKAAMPERDKDETEPENATTADRQSNKLSVEPSSFSSSQTISLAGEGKELEKFVKGVAENEETWVLKIGTNAMTSCEEMLAVGIEGKELVLHATFKRWLDTVSEGFKTKGWTRAGAGTKAFAGAALGAIGIATSGLGLALLLHKGTRDYFLKETEFVKSFPVPLRSPSKVASSIVDAFALLCPEATAVLALKSEKNPP